MKIDKTMTCFENLIFWNCFFCVNRSFVMKSQKKRYCNLISSSVFIIILTIIVYDHINTDINFYKLSYLIVLIVELLTLIVAASMKSLSFDALDRLDEKCDVDSKYFDIMIIKVKTVILLSAMSFLTDVCGLLIIDFRLSESIIYAIVFAAQEIELLFFATIIEGINLRLSKLKTEPVRVWSKVYRHVLVTANKLNEEYTSRIMLILSIALISTVTYSCTIMMLFYEMGLILIACFIWRAFRFSYCIWKLCFASANSHRILQHLAFDLAYKLTFNMCKDKNASAYKPVVRLYKTLLTIRPCYVSSSVISISIGLPLQLLDSSINYILIIIQIYVAYK